MRDAGLEVALAPSLLQHMGRSSHNTTLPECWEYHPPHEVLLVLTMRSRTV